MDGLLLVLWGGCFLGLPGNGSSGRLPRPASTHPSNVANFLTLMEGEVLGPALYVSGAIVWCPSTIGALVVRCCGANLLLASVLICLLALCSPGPVILVC